MFIYIILLGQDSRIHQPDLCRILKPPSTIFLDMTLKPRMENSKLVVLVNVEYSFIAFAPKSTPTGSGST